MFQHDLLEDAQTYIRLLKVLRVETDGTIECELTVWLRDDAPEYVAVSYAWGNPTIIKTITVNQADFVVRRTVTTLSSRRIGTDLGITGLTPYA